MIETEVNFVSDFWYDLNFNNHWLEDEGETEMGWECEYVIVGEEVKVK